MSQIMPCYDREQYNYGQCTIRSGYHEIVGTKSSNPDKCITVLLPTECIPKGDDSKDNPMEKYEKAIAFFRRLRENTCVCNIVLDAETSHYFPAIRAGWEKKDIILRISSLDMEHFVDVNNEVDRYMSEMEFTETQSFHAVYMDEPQNSGYPISMDNIAKLITFRGFVHDILHTRFIISNYDDFWFSDPRDEFAPYCDEIIDDGYNDDFGVLAYSVFQLGSRTLLFSMSNLYPEGIHGIQINPDKVRKYFEWANALPVTSVWLWFGEYHDCQRFWQDLRIACKEAAKSGWATANEIFVETGVRYCKFSDCSKCMGHSYTEDDYWQDQPMGPPCPPAVYEKDIDLKTQSITNFIYSQYSFR